MNVREPYAEVWALMFEMWNRVLSEPVPQDMLDVIDRAAEERGECSGGPDGSTKADAGGSK